MRLAPQVECPGCHGSAFRLAEKMIVCVRCGILTGTPRTPENTTPRADETQRDATQNESVEGEGR